MHDSLGARRRALILAFLATGVAMASWITRTPAIRDALQASTAEMGLVLAGLSVGSLIGISSAGVLVARRGARPVIITGLIAIALGLGVVGLGCALGSAWGAAGGLALLGLGMGAGEIALNVEGVEVERGYGRSVVPLLHGAYSAGTVLGALIGMLAGALNIPVAAHLVVVAGAIVLVSAAVFAGTPAGTGRVVDGAAAGAARVSARVWLDARTLALGVVILGVALAEGSAGDWLPLIAVDGFELDAGAGAFAYTLFGVAMAAGRIGGGPVIDRFGRALVLRICLVAAAVGIALVAFAPFVWIAAVGVVLWGIGAALGFPVALSAAGEDAVHGARRASFVATAGYAAFLVGPPLLGFAGEHLGLRGAIVIVLVVVLVTLVFARAVHPEDAVEREPADR